MKFNVTLERTSEIEAPDKESKRTTNHIIVEIDDSEKAQDIFEEIQNKYNFYDNCVLETDVPEEDSIIEPDRQDETGDTKLWDRV